jgi:hypothetical protein
MKHKDFTVTYMDGGAVVRTLVESWDARMSADDVQEVIENDLANGCLNIDADRVTVQEKNSEKHNGN